MGVRVISKVSDFNWKVVLKVETKPFRDGREAGPSLARAAVGTVPGRAYLLLSSHLPPPSHISLQIKASSWSSHTHPGPSAPLCLFPLGP